MYVLIVIYGAYVILLGLRTISAFIVVVPIKHYYFSMQRSDISGHLFQMRFPPALVLICLLCQLLCQLLCDLIRLCLSLQRSVNGYRRCVWQLATRYRMYVCMYACKFGDHSLTLLNIPCSRSPPELGAAPIR